jgi:hypothetical protein
VTFPGCSASTSSAAAGCLSTTALIRWCWTRCRQGPPVGARPGRVCAHSPASTLYGAEGAGELPRAQAIYAELKPPLEFVVAGGLATTAEAGLGLLGVGIGDPSRPLAPLDDEGRVALKKLLTDA